jgi:hypothetical protein
MLSNTIQSKISDILFANKYILFYNSYKSAIASIKYHHSTVDNRCLSKYIRMLDFERWYYTNARSSFFMSTRRMSTTTHGHRRMCKQGWFNDYYRATFTSSPLSMNSRWIYRFSLSEWSPSLVAAYCKRSGLILTSRGKYMMMDYALIGYIEDLSLFHSNSIFLSRRRRSYKMYCTLSNLQLTLIIMSRM